MFDAIFYILAGVHQQFGVGVAIVDGISHCGQYVAYDGLASSDSSGNNYDIWTASVFR